MYVLVVRVDEPVVGMQVKNKHVSSRTNHITKLMQRYLIVSLDFMCCVYETE